MDLKTVKTVNGLAGKNRSLDIFMALTAKYGHLVFVLYGVLMWFRGGRPEEIRTRRKSLVMILLEVVGCSLASWTAGKLWRRQRPFMKDSRIWNFTGHRANSSFPSSHTANGTVIALQLLRDRLTAAGPLAAWSAVLAFSRLFAGVHYPSDLIGGAAFAGIVHAAANKSSAAGKLASAAVFLWTAAENLVRRK